MTFKLLRWFQWDEFMTSIMNIIKQEISEKWYLVSKPHIWNWMVQLSGGMSPLLFLWQGEHIVEPGCLQWESEVSVTVPALLSPFLWSRCVISPISVNTGEVSCHGRKAVKGAHDMWQLRIQMRNCVVIMQEMETKTRVAISSHWLLWSTSVYTIHTQNIEAERKAERHAQ